MITKIKKRLKDDFRIVENKKKVFLIPALVLVVALIVGFICLGVTGSFTNAGADLTGEYRMVVRLGPKLTDETFDTYKTQSIEIAEALKDTQGEPYALTIKAVERQGDSGDAAIVLCYRTPRRIDEDNMPEVNAALSDALVGGLFEEGDVFAGQAIASSRIAGRLSGDILYKVLIAVMISLILVFIYLAIRFDVVTAVSAVLTLFIQSLLVLAICTLFHVEISALGVAAILFGMCFTLVQVVILFDRIRENRKLYGDKRIGGKLVKPAYLANRSIQEVLPRTISITAIACLPALILLWPVWKFALPLIFGLIAGTYCAVCIAPVLWAMLKTAFPGKAGAAKPKRIQRAKNRDREKLEV